MYIYQYVDKDKDEVITPCWFLRLKKRKSNMTLVLCWDDWCVRNRVLQAEESEVKWFAPMNECLMRQQLHASVALVDLNVFDIWPRSILPVPPHWADVCLWLPPSQVSNNYAPNYVPYLCWPMTLNTPFHMCHTHLCALRAPYSIQQITTRQGSFLFRYLTWQILAQCPIDASHRVTVVSLQTVIS